MKRTRKNVEQEKCTKLSKVTAQPNECLSPSKGTRASKCFNFLSVCREVLSQEYYDVKSRMDLPFIPNCIPSEQGCLKHKIDPAPYQVLSYEVTCFKLDLNSGMWSDALDVFNGITKYNKYPSVDIMTDLILMIFNVQEENHIYSTLFIIRRCQNALKLMFQIHPPCTKDMRSLYRNFFNNFLKGSDVSSLYKIIHDPKNNLLSSIIKMLFQDIMNSSCEDDISAVLNFTSNLDEKNVIKSKEELKAFECFDKCERIKRIVIVLEILIDLLERDLAIWISMYLHDPHEHILRSHKPLLAWIMWQNRTNDSGMINDLCRHVFKIAVNLVKFNYPLSYFKVILRLINILYQIFCLCGKSLTSNYPDIGNNCSSFANEMFNSIKSENLGFVISFIIYIKPMPLQHLLLVNLLKFLINSKENDFLMLAHDIFKQHLWNMFEVSTDSSVVKFHNESLALKIRRRKVSYFYKCAYEFGNEFKILQSNSSLAILSDVRQNHFLDLLYVSFVCFLRVYCIPKIDYLLDKVERNNNSFDVTKWRVNKDNIRPLALKEENYKKYRNFFVILRKIAIMLSDTEEEFPDVYSSMKDINILVKYS